MKKIFILLFIIILSSVGYFSYITIVKEKSDLRNDVSIDTSNLKKETVNSEFIDWQNNSECLGESHEYYDIGFGFETVYDKGSVTSGKDLKITLSCDHKSLKIEGSVNQVIKSKDLSQYFNGEEIELASESLFIEVEKDYNFDGYNDLTSVYSAGSGVSAIYSSLIFLYDSKNNNFVFNKDLSSLNNLSASKEEGLYTNFCAYNKEEDAIYCSKNFYILNDDGKLKYISSKESKISDY